VIDAERIVDARLYHTIKEAKNGQGPPPLRTDAGWLHLAHGVRNTAAGLRYTLYLFVTDLAEPWRVTHAPGGALIVPEGEERVGDVSNVVFANGWILDDDGAVFIYYASSDTRMHVATSSVDRLVDYARNTPPDPLRSAACAGQRAALVGRNLAARGRGERGRRSTRPRARRPRAPRAPRSATSAAAMARELTGNILPYWMGPALDAERGGLVGLIDADGARHADAPKGAVAHARLLWTFSAAHAALGRAEYRAAADRAAAYLRARFVDAEHGGVYWAVDADGAPLDTRKHVYAQAFAVYRAERAPPRHRRRREPAPRRGAVRAGRAARPRPAARRLRGGVRARLGAARRRAAERGRRPRAQEHEHAPPPARGVHQPVPRPARRRRARRARRPRRALPRPHRRRAGRPAAAVLRRRLDRQGVDRVVRARRRGELAAARGGRRLGDPALRARVRPASLRLAEAVLDDAVDREHGGVYYEAAPGRPVDTDKEWWPQAEAIVGFVAAYEETGRDDVLARRATRGRSPAPRRRPRAAASGAAASRATGRCAPGTRRRGPWKCPITTGARAWSHGARGRPARRRGGTSRERPADASTGRPGRARGSRRSRRSRARGGRLQRARGGARRRRPAARAAPARLARRRRQGDAETRALFVNLRRLAGDAVLFGHQDDLAYGTRWRADAGRSDVQETAGSYPAVYGWELGDLERGAPANLDGVDFARMRGWIVEGYRRGGGDHDQLAHGQPREPRQLVGHHARRRGHPPRRRAPRPVPRLARHLRRVRHQPSRAPAAPAAPSTWSR
jgi:hypothetical protein